MHLYVFKFAGLIKNMLSRVPTAKESSLKHELHLFLFRTPWDTMCGGEGTKLCQRWQLNYANSFGCVFCPSFSKEAHNINVNSPHRLSLCLQVFYLALKHRILFCLLQLVWAWVFWKLPRSSTHRRIFFSWGKKWGTLNDHPAELWATKEHALKTALHLPDLATPGDYSCQGSKRRA